jgi:colanic acid biosynthesis glycosyl transferase WcaI
MKILLLNQTFYPDVVSSAQHETDLAVELSARGHQVTVIAGSRGYDDPSVRFSRREVWKGITVIRLASTGLGKRAKWRRAVDFASFMLGCTLRLLLLPRFDAVIAMTSPPLISLLGALFVRIKGGRFLMWIMDLNPDEAIAAGWLREESLTARFFERILRYSLRRAEAVFVLDRFMKRRIEKKRVPETKLFVIPPWSHDDAVGFDEEGRRLFRARHNLSDKYVVMYSGNHSPCHPLDTLLEAAQRLADRPEIAFCFVGGGSEFEKVQRFAVRHRLENIKCLPYQPLDELSASLSAADLHVVVMGDAFTGIIHPCKIYNILAIRSAFLYIGPPESHVADILEAQSKDARAAASVRHGDVDATIRHIVEGAHARGDSRHTNQGELAARFSKQLLLTRMVEVVESVSTEALTDSSNIPQTDTQAV